MTIVDILIYLGETTLAVSILVLLVLIIRKPIAQLFGPRIAYALWIIPAVRLFLPELKFLPAPNTENATTMFALPGDAATFTSASTPIAFEPLALFGAITLMVWVFVGVAWFCLKLEAQSRFTHRKLASSKPASDRIIRQAQAIAKELRLKQTPQLRISDDHTAPCVIGLFKPIIFLPNNFEDDYSPMERKFALAHELSHVARGDMAVILFALVFQASQWPNPLAHFSIRVFRIDQEAACDAFVMSRFSENAASTGDYAGAIVKSAQNNAVAPAYGLSLSHPIKERLMLLKNPMPSALRLLTGGAVVALLAGVSLAGTANYGYAAEDQKNTKVETEERTVIVEVVSEDETVTVDRIVREIDGTHEGNGLHLVEELSDTEGARVLRIHKDKSAHSSAASDNCVSHNGVEPLIFEFKDEKGDDDEKTISITKICISGDDASPEKRAEALRKAIDALEKQGKIEEKSRKAMIKKMRMRHKELEKNQ